MDAGTSHPTRQIDRIALKTFVAIAVVTGILFLWSTTQYRNAPASPDTWLDQAGHVHVLGITLGVSTLREAEAALKSRSDTALYIYPQERNDAGLKLEAYFPAIPDHTKVILRLEADDTELQAMETRATLPHQYPNGVLRMNLAIADLPQIQALKVAELTLVPSVAITPEILEVRFGKADGHETNKDGVTHLHFNGIGLRATLQAEGPILLHFSNPAKAGN